MRGVCQIYRRIRSKKYGRGSMLQKGDQGGMREFNGDDFAMQAATAEKAGGFALALAHTRPAARHLVHTLLYMERPKWGRGRLARGNERYMCSKKHAEAASASGDDDTLLEWLGGVAAGILGSNGVAAAMTCGAVARGATLSPLGALAAAVGAELCKDGAASESPDEYALLRFRSASNASSERWEAELRIPIDENADAIAVHVIVPRCASGTFVFCGIAVSIATGRGTLPVAAFRAGLSRGGVSFARAGAAPVPGAPFWKVDEI